jgi:Rha family phage regulatory protein
MNDSNEPPAKPTRKFLLSLVEARGNKPFADSRQIGKRFGKEHFHVLRDIDTLLSHDPKLDGVDFIEKKQPHPTVSGRDIRYFETTEEGFSLLVMGFTGAEAVAWKRLYIKAFRMMRDELLKQNGEWREVRLGGKDKRKFFQKIWFDKGGTGKGIAIATDEVNKIVLGKNTKTFRIERGLKDGQLTRDHVPAPELTQFALIEQESAALIHEQPDGHDDRDRKKIAKTKFVATKIADAVAQIRKHGRHVK